MQLSIATGLALGRLRRPGPADGGGPTLRRPPALAGPARIGATVALDPGDWAGAERLAFGWLRDGVAIPGAEGAT